MKKSLLASVAAVGLSLGMASYACAQNNPNEEQKRPANERVEKRAPTAGQRAMENKAPAAERMGQAEPKRENEPRTGQTEPAKRAEEQRAGQAATEKRSEEQRAGQAATDKRAEDQRTGQAATEKRAEEQRAGQAATEKRAEEQHAGQAATEKRAEEQRAGQAERADNRRDANERARDVRVEGNLKLSQERAARISDELMRVGRPENINVAFDVGARLPDDVVLEPLPQDIVAMAPEYAGYDYVYVNDRIVFVQPATHEVVGMIDLGGNAVAQQEPALSRAKPCPVD